MVNRTKPVRKRKARTSGGAHNDVLSVEGKDPEFEYRIVNDKPGRIAQMESRDWEIATGEEKLISTFDSSTDDGSVKSRHVGDGMQGVVMRIRKEWLDEDRAEQAKRIDRVDKTLQPKDVKNGYGKVEVD